MGYYTVYSLTVKGAKLTQETLDAMNAWLEDRNVIGYALEKGELGFGKNAEGEHYCAEFYSYDDVKWYQSEEDILDMSEEFPDFTFELHGEGEDQGDLWNAYFHNGEAEWCQAEVIYPEPQRIKWR